MVCPHEAQLSRNLCPRKSSGRSRFACGTIRISWVSRGITLNPKPLAHLVWGTVELASLPGSSLAPRFDFRWTTRQCNEGTLICSHCHCVGGPPELGYLKDCNSGYLWWKRWIKVSSFNGNHSSFKIVVRIVELYTCGF